MKKQFQFLTIILLATVMLVFMDNASSAGIKVTQVTDCDLNFSDIGGMYKIIGGDCAEYIAHPNGVTEIYNPDIGHDANLFYAVSSGGLIQVYNSSGVNWGWMFSQSKEKINGTASSSGTGTASGTNWKQNFTWGDYPNAKPKIGLDLNNISTQGMNDVTLMFVLDVDEQNKRSITFGEKGNKQVFKWGSKDFFVTSTVELAKYERKIEEQYYAFDFSDTTANSQFVLFYIGNLKNLNSKLGDTNGMVLGIKPMSGGISAGSGFSADPKIDVNATGANFQVTTINLWDGSADWNIFFQQSRGGMVMELYDENRLPTTNLATTIHGFDWWNPRSTFLDGAVAASAEEYNDATARLWKKEDLNSRVQIVSEASVQKSSRYDLNTFRTNSIYPIGRTDSGHGLIRWVVHMEFLDTNNATSIADMHNTLAAYATAYDFNAYSDNNVLAPTASEWWYATQYNKGTADANQVFAKGYSGDRALRFYNRMWNPTSASMWDACAGLNGARGMAGWTDSDLNPEFAAGEMEYLNYVIFLADTNWLTNIDYPLKKSLADENRIDYVMQDWRNPDEPFMNAGTYNIATSNNSFDFNVGVYDLNAAVQADLNVLVDFNLDTRGTKNTYNNFYSDMNTMDTNRYRPAFRVNGYTFATQPVVKINSQLGVYDVNYICDVNTTGNYLVCIWYGDLTNPDQNVQIQIASNFPTTGGGSTTHDCDKPPASGTWLIDDGFYCIKYATQIVYAGDVNIFSGGLTFTNNTWLDINSGFTIYRYDNNGLNFFGSIYGSGIK